MEFVYELEKCLDITQRSRNGGYIIRTAVFNEGNNNIVGLVGLLVTNIIDVCVTFSYEFITEEGYVMISKNVEKKRIENKKKVVGETRGIFSDNVTKVRDRNERPYTFISLSSEDIEVVEIREPYLFSITLKSINIIEVCTEAFIIKDNKDKYRIILENLLFKKKDVGYELWELQRKIDNENKEGCFLNSCLIMWNMLAILDYFDSYYLEEKITVPIGEDVSISSKEDILESAYRILRYVSKTIKSV